MSYEDTILETTTEILDTYIGTQFIPSDVTDTIITDCNAAIETHNAAPGVDGKWKKLQKLENFQVERILLVLYGVKQLYVGVDEHNNDNLLLGVYNEFGTEAQRGLYITEPTYLRNIADMFKPSLTAKDFQEIVQKLHQHAPIISRCFEKNLVAVKNGIFNYDTKQLMPFTPDLVFLTKSQIDYNPNAKNVIIHNDEDGTDWDVESWMLDLFDGDKELTECCWEVVGACVRPLQAWDVCAFFYSEKGNNGKGTICSMIRNIIGSGAISLKIADMDNRFALEPVLHATAIITDENPVNCYIDKIANFKLLVTNDSVQIDRKYQTLVEFMFRGFMVQCINDLPRIKDKTDSFYRRMLFIPFMKSFTGKERKYIKHDYLKRKDVLEYVQYRVLNMNYTEISVPQASVQQLNEYKAFNDPTRQFVEEILPELQWDRIPPEFLYDLYKAWYKKNVSERNMEAGSVTTFIKHLKLMDDALAEYGFEFAKSATRVKFDKPEPLIEDYKMQDWYNPNYFGNDINKRCMPTHKEKATGMKNVLVRK